MSRQQKAMEKLLHGHGFANQLERIMDHSSELSESFMERKNLVKSVSHCFSDALSILIDTNDQDQSNNSSSPHETSHVLESSKKPLHKSGKRKTTTESSEYRRHVSPNPYNDGFLWRKYGQKRIKEFGNYQRSYFKCAYYTSEENCEAKKQIQTIQDNPPLYSITYFGHHKCQLHQAYATFPIESTVNPQDQLNMIRFDDPIPNNTNISSSSSSTTWLHHNQSQNQNDIKDVYISHEETEEYSSPSQWMSSEVAHALEALEFNPFCTFNDFS